MSQETKPTETFEQWLDRVAEIKKWNAQTEENPHWLDMYVSRIDGGYLSFSNIVGDLRWLYDAGIDQLQMKSPDSATCTIGFEAANQAWWGWSHRASCWFTIGSSIKKGGLGYVPVDKEDFLEWQINFWQGPYKDDMAGLLDVTNDEGELGCQITWVYSDSIPNKDLRGKTGEAFFPYPAKWGRGEWTAQTLDDAKQMAIDFAESVG